MGSLISILNNDRYRSLVMSIAGLIALIAILLVFTVFATNRLEQNTNLIEVSNRMATNTQSVIKDLFDLESSYGEDISSPHMRTVLDRIQRTSNQNQDYINVLENGGDIAIHTSHSSDTETLIAVPDHARAEFDDIKGEWNKLNPLLQTYLKDARNIMVDSSTTLSLASGQARISTLQINDSLDAMTTKIHESVTATANTIRLVQLVGIGIIFAYFITFLSVFMRRLQESDAELEVARQETEEIMRTVNTGLFLLDKDLRLGNQHSAALVDIIGTDRLGGESLSSILRNRISDKDLQTTEEFIEQLYNPRVKEKLVNSLNPLNKVLFNDGKGLGEGRYLDFIFSRVYDDEGIARILVNVNDVSDAVRLEQRLEKERAQNDRQIEMLTTILNVSPRIINDFIDNTSNRIDKMNNILKNPGSSQFELEGKLKSIYREMHSLKGEASALKLHSFTKIASEAEDKLHGLQNQGKLSGNDFLPLTVHLDELLNLSNTISTLGERINNTGKANQSAPADVVAVDSNKDLVIEAKPLDAKEELGDYLVDFGRGIAERQGKKVEVDVSKMAGTTIPKKLSVAVKEVCVQLLRNAIVHGISDSQTRIDNGKNPVGKVTVSFEEHVGENKDHFMFMVEDDGQGIDYDAIRQKLLTSGRYPAEKVKEFTNAQLLNTLFSSGFSTKAVADEDGGRGVGLDIVKDRVREYGGKINVQSEKGKFSRFVVKLPMSFE